MDIIDYILIPSFYVQQHFESSAIHNKAAGDITDYNSHF